MDSRHAFQLRHNRTRVNVQYVHIFYPAYIEAAGSTIHAEVVPALNATKRNGFYDMIARWGGRSWIGRYNSGDKRSCGETYKHAASDRHGSTQHVILSFFIHYSLIQAYYLHKQSMLTNGLNVLRAPDQHDLMARA